MHTLRETFAIARGLDPDLTAPGWKKLVTRKVDQSPHAFPRFFYQPSGNILSPRSYISISQEASGLTAVFFSTSLIPDEQAAVVLEENQPVRLVRQNRSHRWTVAEDTKDDRVTTRFNRGLLRRSSVFDSRRHGTWLGLHADVDGVVDAIRTRGQG